MPEQPPNKAEELLQRHARERRERGGGFSLHPATRQLLQGEVTRQFAKERHSASRPGIASWFTAWRTVSVSFGLVALLGVGGWMFFRESKQFKTKVELAKAESPNFRPLDDESSVDKAARESGSDLADKKIVVPPPAYMPVPERPADSSTRAPVARESFFARKDFSSTTNSSGVVVSGTSTAAQPAPAVDRQVASLRKMDFVIIDRADTDSLANTADAPIANPSVATLLENSGATAPPAATAPQSLAAAARTLAQRSAAQRGYSNDSAQNALMENRGIQTGVENYAFRNNQQQLPSGAAGNSRGGSVESNTRDRAAALANNDNYPNQQTPTSGPAPAQRQLALNTTMRARRAEPSSRVQVETKMKQLADVAVLSRFSIEHGNEAVRITDADGSVYEGVLSRDRSITARENLDAAKASTPAPAPARAKSESIVSPTRLSFRVTGTNRTLNELVVIDGTFSTSLTNIMFGAVSGITNTLLLNRERIAAQVMPATPAVPSTMPIAESRVLYREVTNDVNSVEGTVRIGTSAERLFRAMRVSP